MGRRAEIALGVVASILLHGLLVWLAPEAVREEPAARPRARKALPVEVRREKAKLLSDLQKEADEVVAELVKVEPPAPSKVEGPKPEPKKVQKKQPPKPAEPPPEAPKPEAAPTPAPGGPAPSGPPMPFVLSNVSLSGGVAVQTGGASNLFGDPSVDARGWKKKGPDAPAGSSGSGGQGEVEERRVVIVPPRALNENDVKKRYPEAHRSENRIVRIELLLSVDKLGAVADARVLKGDKPAFDDESRRTVQQLRFRPATRDGVSIPYQLKWTVVFIPETG